MPQELVIDPYQDNIDIIKNLKLSGVQIEITSTCNFKCNFCPVSGQGDVFPMPSRKYIVEDKFYEIIDSVEGMDLNYLTLNFIGEPMSHPKVFDYMKYINDKNLPLMLVTNGTITNEPTFEKMNKSGLKTLKISLQVANKESFSESRGVKMSYDLYLKKIINVIKAKQKGLIDAKLYLDIAFNNTYTPIKKLLGIYGGDQHVENDKFKLAIDLQLLLLTFKEAGITKNEYTLDELVAMIDSYANESGSRVDERQFMDFGDDIFLSIKNFWDHFAHQNNYPVKNVFCKPNKLVVDIEGDVTVCNRDVLKSTVISNIYKDDMITVFKNVKNSINKISSGNCDFDFCTYCTGAPTKRGAFIRNIINTSKIKSVENPYG